MGILGRTVRSVFRAMCGVELKDRKGSMALMFMLGFERNHGSIGYGKQCLLVWSCVEESGWLCP